MLNGLRKSKPAWGQPMSEPDDPYKIQPLEWAAIIGTIVGFLAYTIEVPKS